MKIISLDALYVQLSAISDAVEKTSDSSEIKGTCKRLIKLLQNSRNFYYQFIHGGCATGFRYSSQMILVNSNKMLATIEASSRETIPELKKSLLSNISEIKRVVEVNNHTLNTLN